MRRGSWKCITGFWKGGALSLFLIVQATAEEIHAADFKPNSILAWPPWGCMQLESSSQHDDGGSQLEIIPAWCCDCSSLTKSYPKLPDLELEAKQNMDLKAAVEDVSQ